MSASFEELEGLTDQRSYVSRQREIPTLTEVKIEHGQWFFADVKSTISLSTGSDGMISQIAFGRFGGYVKNAPERWFGLVDGTVESKVLEQAELCGFEIRSFPDSDRLVISAHELMKNLDFGHPRHAWCIGENEAREGQKTFWLQYLQSRVEDPRAAYHREVDVLTVLPPLDLQDSAVIERIPAPFIKLGREQELADIEGLPSNLRSVALPLAYLDAHTIAYRPPPRGVYGC